MKAIREKFKHGNVAKVGTAYAVVGWLTLQLTEIILPTFNAPQWIAQTIIFVVIMGFPITVLIAWAAENNTDDSRAGLIGTNESKSPLTKKSLTKPFWGAAVIGLSLVALFAFYVSAVLFDFSTTPVTSSTSAATNFSEANVLRFKLDLGQTGSRNNGEPTSIDLSSDGTHIVYTKYIANGTQFSLRDLTSFQEDKELITINTRTGGYPQFSTDDQWVYFFQNNDIKRIRIEGGIPQDVLTGAVRNGFVATESDIFFTKLEDYGLYRRDLNSNEEELILPGSSEGFHTQPTIVSGGKYLITSFGLANRYESSSIELLNLETKEKKTLVPVGYSGAYLSNDYLLFSRAGFLYAQPINPDTMETIGNANPVILDVYHSPDNGYSAYSIALNGTLAYIDNTQSRSSFGGQRGSGYPVWISRDGDAEIISETLTAHGHPSLSPNENEVILNSIDSSSISDLWIYNFSSNTLGRRTFGGGHTTGRWTPDGSRIFFNDPAAISSIAANGTDSPVIEISTGGIMPLSFDPTGNSFIFYSNSSSGLRLSSREINTEIAVTDINLVPDGSTAKEGSISPDGSLLVYTSDETGRDEIYVRPFPNIGNGKWQVSREGGNQALWNKNGSELFFLSLLDDGKYSTTYDLINEAVTFTEPKLLFKRGLKWDPTGSWDYSSTRDSFIGIAENLSEEEILANQTKLSVIQNWSSAIMW